MIPLGETNPRPFHEKSHPGKFWILKYKGGENGYFNLRENYEKVTMTRV